MEYIVPPLIIICILIMGALVVMSPGHWGMKIAWAALLIFLFFAAIDQAITSLSY